jgi:hypothetical protein
MYCVKKQILKIKKIISIYFQTNFFLKNKYYYNTEYLHNPFKNFLKPNFNLKIHSKYI